MGIDQVLNVQKVRQAQGEMSRTLREERRRANPGGQAPEEPTDLRSAVQQARVEKKEAEVKEEKKKEGKLAKALAKFKKTAANFLKNCWLDILPSFGLSLLWVNIHAFGVNIIPQVFCKLGEEWVPDAPDVLGSAESEEPDWMKFLKKLLNIGEPMLLALVDAIVLLIIFSIFVVIAIIVGFQKDPINGTKWLISLLLNGGFSLWK